MADQGARLTPLGKIISIVLILGLIGVGVWIVLQPGRAAASRAAACFSQAPETEAPDTTGVTTVKEYKYVPADRLPPVKGVSQYKWDPNEKILHFTYNVWAGWLPVIAANHGTKPNADSIFSKKYGFRVEMVLMDDPGGRPRRLRRRRGPHPLGHRGHDGAVGARTGARTRAPPRASSSRSTGPTAATASSCAARSSRSRTCAARPITLAQNSPSEYYLTSLLLSAGLSPTDVKHEVHRHGLRGRRRLRGRQEGRRLRLLGAGHLQHPGDASPGPASCRARRTPTSSSPTSMPSAPTSCATIRRSSRAWSPASSRAWTWSRRSRNRPASGWPTPSA